MHCYTLPEPTAAERKIALEVGRVSPARWKTFPSGELFVHVGLETGVAALVGRTAPPSEDFFRTALLADTLRRAGATGVVAAVPYMGYARQDRQESKGDAFSAAFLTNQLAAAGVVRLITVDVHSDRIRESGPARLTSVSPVPDLAPALQLALGQKDFTIVAPDFGARHRAEAFADLLAHREPAWVEKRRDPNTGKVTLMDVHGDLRGDIAVIVDDILDTGGTIELAVKMLRAKRFKTIFLCVTHPVFSKGAAARIRRLGIARIITTNTIPLRSDAAKLPGLKVVDVTSRIAAAVREHAITP
ncbi:MAG TPA: ribose-phosphate diphosphokinase [Candidatus Eisenbacteria bacterium]|nr:ribose-phosphate diphosphokinase [Candidatus Eisenbacteria bacterium]